MSNKSETIKNLAAALAAAQAEMPAAELNATNPFLKNKFADLGSIISTAQPVLAKHGLSVSQLPVKLNGEIGVTTILMHSSGDWIESTVSLPLVEEKGKNLAQVAGSIITYLRRYSLSAILNMYAEEDTDGGAASKEGRKPVGKRTTPSPRAAKAKTPAATTPSTVTELYSMAKSELKMNSQDAATVLVDWLKENHATSSIGSYAKDADAIATLWNVLKAVAGR